MLAIGAGPIGLGVCRTLEANDILYDQIEADGDVGGIWNHGIHESVHTISSGKSTEYAGYPMPGDYPDFPSGEQMKAYYRAFAEDYGLFDRIEFNTKVVMVRPRRDDLWEVELESGELRVYKGVIVCSGRYWDPRMPKFRGHFNGEILHSKDYKRRDQLRGKRVLVIGAGNSGCDLACEAARVGESSHLSLRRGYWFMPKTILGRPVTDLTQSPLPVVVQRAIMRALLYVSVGNYDKYGLPEPDHSIFETHPVISGELLSYLRHGRMRVRPEVSYLDGDDVHFVDGTFDRFDLIACATGFNVSYPFFPEGMIEVEGPLVKLYAGSLLPDFKHLYLVGTAQPRVGVGNLTVPYSELIVDMIKVQDRMKLPLGGVLRAVGSPLPQTHLLNPLGAKRRIHRGKKLLPALVAVERFLRTAGLYKRRPIDEFANAEADADIRVY
jgi:hypothetical protein